MKPPSCVLLFHVTFLNNITSSLFLGAWIIQLNSMLWTCLVPVPVCIWTIMSTSWPCARHGLISWKHYVYLCHTVLQSTPPHPNQPTLRRLWVSTPDTVGGAVGSPQDRSWPNSLNKQKKNQSGWFMKLSAWGQFCQDYLLQNMSCIHYSWHVNV